MTDQQNSQGSIRGFWFPALDRRYLVIFLIVILFLYFFQAANVPGHPDIVDDDIVVTSGHPNHLRQVLQLHVTQGILAGWPEIFLLWLFLMEAEIFPYRNQPAFGCHLFYLAGMDILQFPVGEACCLYQVRLIDPGVDILLKLNNTM